MGLQVEAVSDAPFDLKAVDGSVVRRAHAPVCTAVPDNYINALSLPKRQYMYSDPRQVALEVQKRRLEYAINQNAHAGKTSVYVIVDRELADMLCRHFRNQPDSCKWIKEISMDSVQKPAECAICVFW